MDKKPLGILQVNTLDTTGGAAQIAMNLHKEYEKRGFKTYFAVGKKRVPIQILFKFLMNKIEECRHNFLIS